jgi:hypothetical protein
VTQAELDKLCALWQKRLRLQDWRVTVRLVRKYELPDCYAECVPHSRTKIAKIKIADPSDRDPEWVDETELEWSLVHELMHLYCSDYSPGDDEDVEFETMLNLVSEALVTAYGEAK